MRCCVELMEEGEMTQGRAFLSVVFLLLGRLALVHGDYAAAAKLSERAMVLHASSHILAQITLLHARSLHAMGQFSDALRYYNQVRGSVKSERNAKE